MNYEQLKAIITIVITAAVNVANVVGYAVDAEVWVNAALSVLSAVTIIYAWWKNQNLTPEAQCAQEFLKYLKSDDVNVVRDLYDLTDEYQRS